MYLFGGRDEKGPKNDLYVLLIGKTNLKWVVPNISGKPPSPRYGHSMNYYPDQNIMVIFGGRNDENFSKYGESCLNDVWLLYLEKFIWCKWDPPCGFIPIARYTHCSELCGHSIMIFGGLSKHNYCNADIYKLELDGPKKIICEEIVDGIETSQIEEDEEEAKKDFEKPRLSIKTKGKECFMKKYFNKKT